MLEKKLLRMLRHAREIQPVEYEAVEYCWADEL